MSPQQFFSQIIYYIYIDDLLKNLSLQIYSTNSVILCHIDNRESGIVWRWTTQMINKLAVTTSPTADGNC